MNGAIKSMKSGRWRENYTDIKEINAYAKGSTFEGGVGETIADMYARLTKTEARRFDELLEKLRDNEQTEEEDLELDKLNHKFRGWEYKYANGGGVGQDRYNLSFQYNPSIVKNEYAESVVEKYTKDWKHDNDWDEVSFYVLGLTKDQSENLKRELKMEDVYNIEIEESMYKRGRTVAGSKHVSATKGYRLPHGYKAVKGADKSYNYSRGHKGVKVDAGWRLPKGYEVVEGAYNMKYESGGKFMKGGIAGDIYSLQNPEQFKQLITIYNDLSAQTNLIKNYYLDHTDNSMVFLTAPNVSDIGKDNIYRYVESLRSKGFSIINFKKTIDTDKYENGLSWGNEKGSMIEQSGKEGRANAQWFKLFLIDTIKYESGATLADCWSCKLNSNEKEFACSVYNRMITGHPFCNEENLKNCDKKHLLSAIEKNMNSFSNEGKKLATSIVEKIK
jgi:hypothetical protein